MEKCCLAAQSNGSMEIHTHDQQPDVEGLVVYRCPECNRRHFELTVDPIHLGITAL